MCSKSIAPDVSPLPVLMLALVLIVPTQNFWRISPNRTLPSKLTFPEVIPFSLQPPQEYQFAQSRKGVPKRRVGGSTRHTA